MLLALWHAGSRIDAVEVSPRNSVFISDPDGRRIEMLAISAGEWGHEREGTPAFGP